MPFVKRGKFYYSPSGRRWTKKQVVAYYASHGTFSKAKKKKKRKTRKKKITKRKKGKSIRKRTKRRK